MYAFRRSRSGLKLIFLERKARPVVVLFNHGNPSCKEVFEWHISAMGSSGLSVVAADLPGYGASDDTRIPARTYSFPRRTPRVGLDEEGIAAGFQWTARTSLAGRGRFGREIVTRYLRAMIAGRGDPWDDLAAVAARMDRRARTWMAGNAFARFGVDKLRSVPESLKPLAIAQGRKVLFHD
jgi:hypothetical protein